MKRGLTVTVKLESVSCQQQQQQESAGEAAQEQQHVELCQDKHTWGHTGAGSSVLVHLKR
jgi:hypothetical protein